MPPTQLLPDHDRWYDAVASRDARFDGWFIVGVRTTGIYCRPSCPTPVRPHRRNVDFFATAAAAQRNGFRACKRCRPDATPGSPAWDVRADLIGRAMRLIADGVVDREGVVGLAARLSVSQRHLHRSMRAELGAGPLDVARAHRAQTARVLIETTEMKLADVAFASGFSSVRQFNDTIRAVYSAAPSSLRPGRRGQAVESGLLSVRLPVRQPFDGSRLLRWLAHHVPEPLARSDDVRHQRSLALPGGTAVVTLTPAADHVRCDLRLTAVSDLPAAVARCRRMLDLDADPLAVADLLGEDPALAPLVAARPGLRVPGAPDGFEAAALAVLGQQVSVHAARTFGGRIVERLGSTVPDDDLKTFPSAARVAEADLSALGVTAARMGALRALATAVADGLSLEPGADRAAARARLLALPGVGPWTADVVAMRALRDPDVLPVGDLVLRGAARAAGLPALAPELVRRGAAWAPWRSYATHHLWSSAMERQPKETP